MGRRWTIRLVGAQTPVTAIKTQPLDRGQVYIAEDLRGQWQILSHTMTGLSHGIKVATHQYVSTSSLSEAHRGVLQGGRTAGAFAVRKLSRDEAIAHLNATSGEFQRRAFAMIDPTAVHLGSNQ